MIRFLFLSLLVGFNLIISSKTSAETLCNVYNATYEPNHYDKIHSDYNYSLSIEENDNARTNGGPKAYFKITVSEKSNDALLQEFELPFWCTQGVPRCFLSLSENINLDVLPISKDFKPIYSFNEEAPYALAIPNTAAAIHRANINELKVKFPKKNNFKPIDITALWLFKNCKE